MCKGCFIDFLDLKSKHSDFEAYLSNFHFFKNQSIIERSHILKNPLPVKGYYPHEDDIKENINYNLAKMATNKDKTYSNLYLIIDSEEIYTEIVNMDKTNKFPSLDYQRLQFQNEDSWIFDEELKNKITKNDDNEAKPSITLKIQNILRIIPAHWVYILCASLSLVLPPLVILLKFSTLESVISIPETLFIFNNSINQIIDISLLALLCLIVLVSISIWNEFLPSNLQIKFLSFIAIFNSLAEKLISFLKTRIDPEFIKKSK